MKPTVVPVRTEVLEKLINYLASKPFLEVAGLIQEISAEIGRAAQQQMPPGMVQPPPPPAPELDQPVVN